MKLQRQNNGGEAAREYQIKIAADVTSFMKELRERIDASTKSLQDTITNDKEHK